MNSVFHTCYNIKLKVIFEALIKTSYEKIQISVTNR
jgi:hypothetical protein